MEHRVGPLAGKKVKKELPEYKDMKLCYECVLTLLDIGEVCPYCGERYNMPHSCEAEKEAIEKLRFDLENPEVQTCNKCGYYEEVRHDLGGVDDLGVFFDESYSTFKCRKFNFALEDMKYYNAQKFSSYISDREYQEKCLAGAIEKENIQVVIDFSSLKDTLIKGGIVMSTCACPKCNAMLDIPEAGKVTLCKYCGTSIKPVDIFQHIKSLL